MKALLIAVVALLGFLPTAPAQILKTTEGKVIPNPLVPFPAPQFVVGIEDVAFSATPTFSVTAQISRIVLTGNVLSSTLAAGAKGAQKGFIICQDSTGGRTFAWPPLVKGAGAIGTNANTCTTLTLFYNDATGYAFWYSTSATLTNQ